MDCRAVSKLSAACNVAYFIPGQNVHDKGLLARRLGLLPRRNYLVRQGEGMNIAAATRNPGGDEQWADIADPADFINAVAVIDGQTRDFLTGIAARPADRPGVLENEK
jgi:hypothetical protein